MPENLPTREFIGEVDRFRVAVAGGCWLGAMMAVAAFATWMQRREAESRDTGRGR